MPPLTSTERRALTSGLSTFFPGLVISLLWTLTHAPALITAGLIALPVGALGLLTAFWLILRSSASTPRQLALIGVLALEIPAAIFITTRASDDVLNSHVELRNDSTEVLTGLQFIDPAGQRHPVAPIDPGQHRADAFTFSGEGAVRWELDSPRAHQAGVLFGYVSGPTGQRAQLVVQPTGELTVKQSP